jgi:hypothetical protein
LLHSSQSQPQHLFLLSTCVSSCSVAAERKRLRYRQEQEEEVRQVVEALVAAPAESGEEDYEEAAAQRHITASAGTTTRRRRRRRVLLMMEAAERGLGEWTAVLPGAEAALRRAASSEGTGTEPACSDVSLHAVLGEVRKSVCISRARACMPPSGHLLPACLPSRRCPCALQTSRPSCCTLGGDCGFLWVCSTRSCLGHVLPEKRQQSGPTGTLQSCSVPLRC